MVRNLGFVLLIYHPMPYPLCRNMRLICEKKICVKSVQKICVKSVRNPCEILAKSLNQTLAITSARFASLGRPNFLRKR
jgi:hypothetical protein